MEAKFKKNSRKYSLKQLLIAGLLVWLPIVASIWVIRYIIGFTDSLMELVPSEYRPDKLLGFSLPGIGLLVALIILFVTGLFTANVIGRKILHLWDYFFSKIPFIKSVYFGVKKVSESVLSESRDSFKDPVLVPFPNENTWSIGFISGSIPKEISEKMGNDPYVSVYVPTTPNPTGGYFVFFKTSHVKAIDLSIDEALKYVISLGIMTSEENNTDNII